MKEKMSLYKLDQTMKEVIESGFSFNEETGEITFTIDDLESLQMSIDEKINNIVGYIKDLNIETKNLKSISDEYKDRAESKKKKAEKLKEYLDSFMTTNNLEKKEVLNGMVSYRSSTSTDIYDEQALLKYIEEHKELEDRYTSKEIKLSKTEIGKDLKADDTLEIPGVKLSNNRNIQIK